MLGRRLSVTAATPPGLPPFLPQSLSLPGEHKPYGAWKGRQVTAVSWLSTEPLLPGSCCGPLPLLQQGGGGGRKGVWTPWEMKQFCGTSCRTDADGGNDIPEERAGQSDPGTRGASSPSPTHTYTPAVDGGRTLKFALALGSHGLAPGKAPGHGQEWSVWSLTHLLAEDVFDECPLCPALCWEFWTRKGIELGPCPQSLQSSQES